jgi:NAD(P)H-nitrite reductase large subunit
VNKVDLSRRPFKLWTDEKEVTAQTLIIATGAVAKRLPFKGSDEDTGFWNKGISACAVCDGAAPIFRNKPIAVIGGGDSAMEEAMFLTKYGSEVSRHWGKVPSSTGPVVVREAGETLSSNCWLLLASLNTVVAHGFLDAL